VPSPLRQDAERQLSALADILDAPRLLADRKLTALFLAAQAAGAVLMVWPGLPHGQPRLVVLIAWLCVLITGLSAIRHHTNSQSQNLDRRNTEQEQTIDEAHRLTQYEMPLLWDLMLHHAGCAQDTAHRLLPGVNIISMLTAPLISAVVDDVMGVPVPALLGPALNVLCSAVWLCQVHVIAASRHADLQATLAHTAGTLILDQQQNPEEYEHFRRAQTDALLDQISFELDRIDRHVATAQALDGDVPADD